MSKKASKAAPKSGILGDSIYDDRIIGKVFLYSSKAPAVVVDPTSFVPDIADLDDMLTQLSAIKRYNSAIDYSVLEHLNVCAALPCIIREYPQYFSENLVNSVAELSEFDLARLTILCLLHDFHEIIIGDITHPIKRRSKEVYDFFESLEDVLNFNVIKGLVLNPLYANIMKHGHYTPYESNTERPKGQSIGRLAMEDLIRDLIVKSPSMPAIVRDMDRLAATIEQINFLCVSEYTDKEILPMQRAIIELSDKPISLLNGLPMSLSNEVISARVIFETIYDKIMRILYAGIIYKIEVEGILNKIKTEDSEANQNDDDDDGYDPYEGGN